MILFYVFGNGLGHLNRVVSYIKHKSILFEKCIIVTNSEYLDYIPESITIIKKPLLFFRNRETVIPWLTNQLSIKKIEELVIDVYPCGFYGELTLLDTLKIKKTLLARLLKPYYFRKNTTKPLYDNLVVVEEDLEADLYNAKEIEFIYLKLDSNYNSKTFNTPIEKPFFLIMHSGPNLEVEKLLDLAKTHRNNNQHIFIQTFCELVNIAKKDDLTIIQREKPYLELLNNAEKIFTGAGYNTFGSMENYRGKQIMMPFVRGYDDQFKRKHSI